MSARHATIPTAARQAWRRAVLERAKYRCQHCGRAGRLEADHIKPLDQGGAALDLANGQALCRGCHIVKTKAERGQRCATPGRNEWRRRVSELAAN